MACLISADGHSAELQDASSGLKIKLGENWREMSKNIPVKFTPMPPFSGSHDFQEPSQLLWRPAEAGSPLTKAANSGDKEEVERLLFGGADVNHRDAGGATALIMASQNGHGAIVENNAVVRNSVVLARAVIGARAVVSRSIIGPTAEVPPGTLVADTVAVCRSDRPGCTMYKDALVR